MSRAIIVNVSVRVVRSCSTSAPVAAISRWSAVSSSRRHADADQVDGGADRQHREQRRSSGRCGCAARRAVVIAAGSRARSTPPSGTRDRPAARTRRPSFQAIDAVGAGRDVVDPVAPLGVGHREERVAEDQDERVHVRVDVAEHAHDAGAIEADGLRPAGGVAAEVEARASSRAKTRCGRCGRCSGNSTVVPVVIASTWGTKVSLRWSITARRRLGLLERAARRRFEIHDRRASASASGAAARRGRRRPAAGARAAGERPQLDASADRRRCGRPAQRRRPSTPAAARPPAATTVATRAPWPTEASGACIRTRTRACAAPSVHALARAAVRACCAERPASACRLRCSE